MVDQGIQDVNLAKQRTEEDMNIQDKRDLEGNRSEDKCLNKDAIRGIQDVNLAEQQTEEDTDMRDQGDLEGDKNEEKHEERDTSAVRGIQDVNLAEQQTEEDMDILDKGDLEGDRSEEKRLKEDAIAVRAFRGMIMPRQNSAKEIGEEGEDGEDCEGVGSESQCCETDGSEVEDIPLDLDSGATCNEAAQMYVESDFGPLGFAMNDGLQGQDEALDVGDIIPGPSGMDSSPGPSRSDYSPGPSGKDGSPGPSRSDYSPGPSGKDNSPGPSRSDYSPGPSGKDSSCDSLECSSSESDSEDISDYVPPSDSDELSDFIQFKSQRHGKHPQKQPQGGKIMVKKTSNENGRKYDKRQICFYCEQPQAKLPRHLQGSHGDESAVSDWMSEKDKKLKAAKLTKLRNLGNHIHNSSVLEKGEGELIVRYRPTESVDPTDFVPCPTCYGYYARKFLWKHSCPLDEADKGKGGGKKRGQRVRKGTMLLPRPGGCDSEVHELLSSLRPDDISRCIKSDDLILKLARSEMSKLGHDKEQLSYIRTKLREMGRLLKEARIVSNQPNSSLADFIHPSKYNIVVTAAKNIAGFDVASHLYKVPSLALKVGHTIKKCALILKAEALISSDMLSVSQVTNFIAVCEMKWTEDISRHAHRTFTETKRNQPKRLPLAEDINCLTTYLKKAGEEEKANLAKGESLLTSWKTLNEVTLTSLMLFNRRRQGEVSKMTVEDYGKRSVSEASDSLSAALSDFEKELCKSLKRVEIVGKKGRTVPVLFTKHVEESLNILLNFREQVGVSPENNFLFPRVGSFSTGHIRGSDCIRKFSILCGAKNPMQLRSTSLRKHVATISQVFNLTETEVDMLAKFMGHDLRVHREFYRLPEATLQVAKISKILLSMENNVVSRSAGKSLNEIQLDPAEEIELDPSEESNESSGEETDAEDNDESFRKTDEKDMQSAASQNGESPSTSTSKKQKKDIAKCSTSEDEDEDEDEDPTSQKQRKRRQLSRRRQWTKSEKEVVLKAFKRQIALNQLPGKTEIEKVLLKHPCLEGRTWRNVKDFVRNYCKARSKRV